MALPFNAQQVAGIVDRRPDPRSSWTGGNLLVATLLLAGAVPFNNARAQTGPLRHPSHALATNADTSRGTPKTLFADAAKAFFVAPHFGPQFKGTQGFLHPDTTRGTPKTLIADAVTPAFNAPWRPIQVAPGLLADTSRGTPAALSAAVPVPTFNPPWRPVQIVPAVLQDTSRGIPAPLTANTPAPTFNAQWLATALLRLATADTSQSTPKVLYADAVSPFFNTPQVTPDRTRPVADTSGFLIPPATPIANQPSLSVVALPVPVSDTSQSTPKPLFADDATPAFNAPHLRLDWPGQVTDTSQGVAQALLPVPPPPDVAPFTNTFLSQLDRPAIGPDTSYGTPLALLPIAVRKAIYGGRQRLERARIERENEELVAIAALLAPLLEGPWLR